MPWHVHISFLCTYLMPITFFYVDRVDLRIRIPFYFNSPRMKGTRVIKGANKGPPPTTTYAYVHAEKGLIK